MILVDTSFFYALASAKDADHERARRELESFANRRLNEFILTTNHIVFETIQLAKARRGHHAAVSIDKELYLQKIAKIYWASQEEEQEAFAYMAKYHDQVYSIVDCLSFVVMERLDIREALTLDSDFTHRFVARPGPS